MCELLVPGDVGTHLYIIISGIVGIHIRDKPLPTTPQHGAPADAKSPTFRRISSTIVVSDHGFRLLVLSNRLLIVLLLLFSCSR